VLFRSPASDLVPERQTFSALDKQVRFEQLRDGSEQGRRLPAERLGELRERERPPQRRGHGHGLICRPGQAREPLAHASADAVGQSAIQDLRAAIDDADPVFLLQPEQCLDHQVGAAGCLPDEIEDMVIGLTAQEVCRQASGRSLAEGTERDDRRTALFEMLDRARRVRCRFWRWTPGNKPGDGRSRERAGQSPEGGPRYLRLPIGHRR